MKILIDLSKFRDCKRKADCDKTQPAGVIYGFPDNDGLKTIRELSVFYFTCRRCEEAPCIGVCPSEALEKQENGIISRAINLCISCKSCVVICPFGTLMTDFFEFKRHADDYFNLDDKKDIEEFIKACPEGAVQLTEIDANEQDEIFQLNERILIKESSWEKLKK